MNGDLKGYITVIGIGVVVIGGALFLRLLLDYFKPPNPPK